MLVFCALQTKYVGFTDGKDKRIIEKPHNNYQPQGQAGVNLGWEWNNEVIDDEILLHSAWTILLPIQDVANLKMELISFIWHPC